MSTSIYRSMPLGREKKQIRLLRFSRDAANGDLVGELSVHSLDGEHKAPSYIALSYTWDSYNFAELKAASFGPPLFDLQPSISSRETPRTLTIDGQRLPIRENLWLALHTLLNLNIYRELYKKALEIGDVTDRVWTRIFDQLKDECGSRGYYPTLETHGCPEHATGWSEAARDRAATFATAAAFENWSMYSDYNYWWIDAICIDQSNVTERGHQVGLMKEIFSKASLVFGWLTPDRERPVDRDMISALRWIETRTGNLDAPYLYCGCNHLNHRQGPPPDEAGILPASELEDLLQGGRADQTDQQLAAVSKFVFNYMYGPDSEHTGQRLSIRMLADKFERNHGSEAYRILKRYLQVIQNNPYWRRTWILQEIILAPRVYFLYECLGLEAGSLLATAIDTYTTERDLEMILLDRADYHDPEIRGSLRLTQLLQTHSRASCSDERDKVYALLGLLDDDFPIKPDYSISIGTLFLRLLRVESSASDTDLSVLIRIYCRGSSDAMMRDLAKYQDAQLDCILLKEQVCRMSDMEFAKWLARKVREEEERFWQESEGEMDGDIDFDDDDDDAGDSDEFDFMEEAVPGYTEDLKADEATDHDWVLPGSS